LNRDMPQWHHLLIARLASLRQNMNIYLQQTLNRPFPFFTGSREVFLVSQTKNRPRMRPVFCFLVVMSSFAVVVAHCILGVVDGFLGLVGGSLGAVLDGVAGAGGGILG